MKGQLFVFCILVSIVAGCTQKQETSKQDEIIPVRITKVELQDIKQSLNYIGNIKARDEAIIYPKVSGKIIEKLKEDGSSVDKGDVLAYIDRDEVGFTFEKAPVESPLTGIIARVYVDKGTSVTPQTPVALIVDMDKVRIQLDIPERYVGDIALEQDADIYVDAYPGERFMGKLTKISPVIDLETRTMPVEITIDNEDHRLKSGMFARVSLIIKEIKDAPVILKETIIGKGPDLYVYVVEGDKAVMKKIKTGIRQNGYLEVRYGLKEGEWVVIMGQRRLRDGSGIKVEQ